MWNKRDRLKGMKRYVWDMEHIEEPDCRKRLYKGVRKVMEKVCNWELVLNYTMDGQGYDVWQKRGRGETLYGNMVMVICEKNYL